MYILKCITILAVGTLCEPWEHFKIKKITLVNKKNVPSTVLDSSETLAH